MLPVLPHLHLLILVVNVNIWVFQITYCKFISFLIWQHPKTPNRTTKHLNIKFQVVGMLAKYNKQGSRIPEVWTYSLDFRMWQLPQQIWQPKLGWFVLYGAACAGRSSRAGSIHTLLSTATTARPLCPLVPDYCHKDSANYNHNASHWYLSS